MSPTSLQTVSLIIPCHNEEEVLPQLLAQLNEVCQEDSARFEFVFVNDGSRDRTLELLENRQREDARIKIIDLSRNFGKEAALTAGLDFCRGDAAIPIDADLQDSPELIPQMIALWREGWDVVYAKRADRSSDSPFKRLSAELFYRFFNLVTDIRIPENTGDYRLMDRRVIEALKLFRERCRFMKGLFAAAGFRQTSIEFSREARQAGTTKWNYWKLWNFALDGLAAFSTFPLRLWTYVGVLVSSGAFIYAAFLIIRVILTGRDVPGYASLMVVMLGLGGIQIISLGFFGEYLGRIYLESKGRPIYIPRTISGWEKQEKSDASSAS